MNRLTCSIVAVVFLGVSAVACHTKAARVLTPPMVANPFDSALNGVAATVSRAWTAGYVSGRPGDPYKTTLTELWQQSWNIVPSPNRSSFYNILNGVATVRGMCEDRENGAWAVGTYLTGIEAGDYARTLTLSWCSKTGWQLGSSPNFDTGACQAFQSLPICDDRLYGVSGTSASDVWAVGMYDSTFVAARPIVMHWDGKAWNTVAVPTSNDDSIGYALWGVATLSPKDAWAVGSYGYYTGPAHALIYRLEGSAWSIVPGDEIGTINDVLTGVSAVGPNDVWAVGFSLSGVNPGSYSAVTEHWDGNKWKAIPAPGLGTQPNRLNGVSAVSPHDVWAVGNVGHRGLILHWDGEAWSVVPNPASAVPRSFLNGVAAASWKDVWAVGSRWNGAVYVSFTEHWNGTAWSIIPSP